MHRYLTNPENYYRVDPETGCWVWLRAKNLAGYSVGHRVFGPHDCTSGHIIMWELLRGPVPAGMQLDHLCRNRACVNPDHLEPVPAIVNVRRSRSMKLSDEEVAEIRRLALRQTQKSIAEQYRVSRGLVSMIVAGKHRAH